MRKAHLAFLLTLTFVFSVCAGASAQLNMWAQLAKLTTSDGASWVGLSSSISRDTLVVGASEAEIHVSGSAVYVFVKPSSGWANMTQVARLTASDSPGYFGNSVSISGDTIVVGAPGANNGSGAAYVYVKAASGWKDATETAKLTVAGGSDGSLGNSVSISGDTIVVGSPGAFTTGLGSAYVYVKPVGGWTSMTQTAKLTSSDVASGDNFGWSSGISGDTVAVSAPQFLNANGKGYVFVKPAGGWVNMTQTAELTASDGGSQFGFGTSIAIAADTVAVGEPYRFPEPAAAYVFVKPQTGWVNMTETAELTTPQANGWFGFSVATNASLVVVGDYLFGPSSPFGDEGAAFVYAKPYGGWKTTSRFNAKLTGSDARFFSFLGMSVSISGNTVTAGSPTESVGFRTFAGATYVFVRP